MHLRSYPIIRLSSWNDNDFGASTTRLDNIDIYIGHSLTKKISTSMWVETDKHEILITPS